MIKDNELSKYSKPFFSKKNNLDNASSINLISPSYLKMLCWGTILCLLFILFFIEIIDPYGVSPLNINIPHINIHKVKRNNIDRLIKPYEVWRNQPKTILMGTSRIHQSIDPSVFEGTQYAPAYNAAIPASTLEENAAHIEQYLKLDPNIKHIFLELFLYNFSTPQTPVPAKTYQKLVKDNIPLHFSTHALFHALKTILININHGPIPGHIAKEGHWIPSSDFNPANTFSETLFIDTVIGWDRSSKTSLQPTAFASLDRIVKMAQEHRVKLHLLITPNYPWDDYRLLTLGYWPLLQEWLEKMSHYKNVVSFSQYNRFLVEKPTLHPKMKWWNDPIHFSLNMGHAMMETYLKHSTPETPKNFMRILNSETLKSITKNRYNAVLSWATANPDFVQYFENAKTSGTSVKGTLTKTALIINGKRHPITLGVGEVSVEEKRKESIYINGWTIDEKAKMAVNSVIATIGSKVVAQGFASVKRADIELAIGKNPLRSGITLDIPFNHKKQNAPIRVFAIMNNGEAVQLTSLVPSIDGNPISKKIGKLDRSHLIINKNKYPIVERFSGSIESITPTVEGYTINGWAADTKAKASVAGIVAVVGSRVVAKSLATILRDDINNDIKMENSLLGFNINIPFTARDEKNLPVQLFALMSDGIAAPLNFNLNNDASIFFKKVSIKHTKTTFSEHS